MPNQYTNGTAGLTPLERFFRYVDVTEGCWNWQGGKRRHGYGSFHYGKTVAAHRYCYETLVGSIPADLEPDHLCRNTACVRPDHLELVTHKENARRGVGPSSRWRNTHCIHGHEFTEKNTYIKKNGHRDCRRCHADRKYRYAHASTRRGST